MQENRHNLVCPVNLNKRGLLENKRGLLENKRGLLESDLIGYRGTFPQCFNIINVASYSFRYCHLLVQPEVFLVLQKKCLLTLHRE